MGIFDKAKDMIRGNEKHADTAVDKAGDMVDQRTGGQHAQHVDKGQDFLKQQYGGGQSPDPAQPAPGQNPDFAGEGGAGVDGAPTDNQQGDLQGGMGEHLGQQGGQADQGFGTESPLDDRSGDVTPGQEGMGMGSPDQGFDQQGEGFGQNDGFGPDGQPHAR